jgi:hypothetical protein
MVFLNYNKMRLSYTLTASLMLLASGSLLRSRLSDDRGLAFTEVESSDRPSQNYGVVFDISIVGSHDLPDILSPEITFNEDVVSRETTKEGETSHATDDSQQMTTDLNKGETDATRTDNEAASSTTQRDEETSMETEEQISQADASIPREIEASHEQATTGQAFMQSAERVKKSFIQLQLNSMTEPDDFKAAINTPNTTHPITNETETAADIRTEDSMMDDEASKSEAPMAVDASMMIVAQMNGDMIAGSPVANGTPMHDNSMMTHEPLKFSITTTIEFSAEGEEDNTEEESNTEAQDTKTEEEAETTEAEGTTTAILREPTETQGNFAAEREARDTDAEGTTTAILRERTETQGNFAAEKEARDTDAEGTTTAILREPTETQGNFAAEREARDTDAEGTTTAILREPTETQGNFAAEREARDTDAEGTTTATKDSMEVQGTSAKESRSAEADSTEADPEEESTDSTSDISATKAELTAQRAAEELMRQLVADEVQKVLAANKPLKMKSSKSNEEGSETEASTTEESGEALT